MYLIIQLAITGVSMGMLYALMAMGLILIVKAVGFLNFAHGQLFMLGAYLTWMLTYQMNLPLIGVVICGIVCFAICGMTYMFVCYWPLRNSPWKVTVIISTLGASIAIPELVRIVWGSNPLTMDPIMEELYQEAHEEGQYKATEDMLYTSIDVDTPAQETDGDPYTLDGDTLTLDMGEDALGELTFTRAD